MSKILLSIKPEYVSKIFSGSKLYEYRKHIALKDVHTILVYSTSPDKLIFGEVEVLGTLAMEKMQLWEYTKLYSGISFQKYLDYFRDSSIAYAYVLGKVTKYDTPKTLSDFGIMYAPQSFLYI